MIRRDYILRMIEEFMQLLSRISSLKKGQLWSEAHGVLDEEFKRMIRAGAEAAAQMSETELLAKILEGEPTQAVQHKTLLLTSLLKEAAEVAAAQNRPQESHAYSLKGLNLLLETLARGETSDFPAFVPTVDVFLEALQDAPLPRGTMVRLMQHYERLGEFGKAEDALYTILDAQPEEPALLGFGMSFYQRLRSQSDSSLAAGNLPREEVEAGLAELERRSTSRSTT